MTTFVLLLIALVGLAPAVWADATPCPLPKYESAALPTGRQAEQCPRRVRRFCKRMEKTCQEAPLIQVCQFCGTQYSAFPSCTPPNPTEIECCQAGFDVGLDNGSGPGLVGPGGCQAICASWPHP